MEMKEMANEALNTESDLKIIMKGEVVENDNGKIGVTSTIFLSKDKNRVKELFDKLCQDNPEDFYMIYAVNLDEKLDEKEHYPSIAIFPQDLN